MVKKPPHPETISVLFPSTCLLSWYIWKCITILSDLSLNTSKQNSISLLIYLPWHSFVLWILIHYTTIQNSEFFVFVKNLRVHDIIYSGAAIHLPWLWHSPLNAPTPPPEQRTYKLTLFPVITQHSWSINGVETLLINNDIIKKKTNRKCHWVATNGPFVYIII